MNVVGYVRVSTEDQAKEGVSLDAQKKKIELYCELKGFNLIDIIADEGISAKDLNRPGVKNLLDRINAGEFKAVIVYKLDRIFRSTIDALETSQKLRKIGVALHSIQENLDTESAIGRFFFTLLSALGQMERELIGERTKMALSHLKENGRVYATIPYGKKREGDRLINNPKEQKIITKIMATYILSQNYSTVARALNDQGIKTRSGKAWYPQQIKNIVRGE